MIRRVLILSCAVALSAAAPPANDEQALLAVEHAWNEAVVKRDVKTLDRIIADDFVLIWIDGSVARKADLIKAVTARKAEIDPFVTEDVLVRVHGDSAILTGRFAQTARLGERSETYNFRYTDVYRRTPQGWRAVSAHASLLKAK